MGMRIRCELRVAHSSEENFPVGALTKNVDKFEFRVNVTLDDDR